MDALVQAIDLYAPQGIVLSLWVILAGGVGLLAGRRGLSTLVWFLFSFVASPALGIVLLALVTPRQRPGRPS